MNILPFRPRTPHQVLAKQVNRLAREAASRKQSVRVDPAIERALADSSLSETELKKVVLTIKRRPGVELEDFVAKAVAIRAGEEVLLRQRRSEEQAARMPGLMAAARARAFALSELRDFLHGDACASLPRELRSAVAVHVRQAYSNTIDGSVAAVLDDFELGWAPSRILALAHAAKAINLKAHNNTWGLEGKPYRPEYAELRAVAKQLFKELPAVASQLHPASLWRSEFVKELSYLVPIVALVKYPFWSGPWERMTWVGEDDCIWKEGVRALFFLDEAAFDSLVASRSLPDDVRTLVQAVPNPNPGTIL